MTSSVTTEEIRREFQQAMSQQADSPIVVLPNQPLLNDKDRKALEWLVYGWTKSGRVIGAGMEEDDVWDLLGKLDYSVDGGKKADSFETLQRRVRQP